MQKRIKLEGLAKPTRKKKNPVSDIQVAGRIACVAEKERIELEGLAKPTRESLLFSEALFIVAEFITRYYIVISVENLRVKRPSQANSERKIPDFFFRYYN